MVKATGSISGNGNMARTSILGRERKGFACVKTSRLEILKRLSQLLSFYGSG
jgi:hypothetical protein